MNVNIKRTKIIPNAKYGISRGGCSYLQDGMIYIGLPPNHDLTDDEVIVYTAELIDHEFMHHVLNNLFSETASCLFDAIGDGLRERHNLVERVFALCGVDTWSDSIKRHGFGVLLGYYHWIDREEVAEILAEGC